MGMSAFKLFLILAAVGVLFLPTLIRRSSALPAALEQLRSEHKAAIEQLARHSIGRVGRVLRRPRRWRRHS